MLVQCRTAEASSNKALLFIVASLEIRVTDREFNSVDTVINIADFVSSAMIFTAVISLRLLSNCFGVLLNKKAEPFIISDTFFDKSSSFVTSVLFE